MNKDKISSQEIIDSIAFQLKINKRSAEAFLKELFAAVEEALLNGESVKIKNLGTFKLQWNEARKSINVTTGEEILLDGYNKVTFIPEAKLKEIVNEPFAFLEPVMLDDDTTKIETLNSENAFDPLNILSDQASEIKELLLEINGLTSVKSDIISEATVEEIDESEENETSEEVDDLIENNNETSDKNSNIENEEIKVHPEPYTNENEISEVIDNDDKNKSEESEVVEIQKPEIDETQLNSIEEKTDSAPIVSTYLTNEASNEPELSIQHLEGNEEIGQDSSTENEKIEIDDINEYTELQDLSEKSVVKQETENKANKRHTESESKFIFPPTILSTPDAFSLPVKPKKRPKMGCLIFILIFSLLVGGFIVNYYLSSATRCWIKYSLLSEENANKINNIDKTVINWINGFKEWLSESMIPEENKDAVLITQDSAAIQPDTISTVNLPIDTIADTVKTPKSTMVEAIDSLKLLFDGPRVYPNTLAFEKIKDGSRLTLIAERYYGLKDFWVYIYEANKDQIPNPDNIPNGIEIRIPKVDKRLINKNNPDCVKKAKELHDLYVGKKK